MVEKYFGNSYAWLNINVEGISDYSEISQTYQIDRTLVKYALYEYKMSIVNIINQKNHL